MAEFFSSCHLHLHKVLQRRKGTLQIFHKSERQKRKGSNVGCEENLACAYIGGIKCQKIKHFFSEITR